MGTSLPAVGFPAGVARWHHDHSAFAALAFFADPTGLHLNQHGASDDLPMATSEHRNRARGAQQRQRIAAAAAALISEGGVHDPMAARRKAAQRLGIRDERLLPEREEIETALREHQRLFGGVAQPLHLQYLRRAAHDAMGFLSAFHPRLVGSVLDGTADRHSSVCLHLFSDAPEAVLTFLAEQGVAFDQRQRHVQLDREHHLTAPVLKLLANGVPFALTVLPLSALHQPPLEDSGDRPAARASLFQLERLLQAAP